MCSNNKNENPSRPILSQVTAELLLFYPYMVLYSLTNYVAIYPGVNVKRQPISAVICFIHCN